MRTCRIPAQKGAFTQSQRRFNCKLHYFAPKHIEAAVARIPSSVSCDLAHDPKHATGVRTGEVISTNPKVLRTFHPCNFCSTHRLPRFKSEALTRSSGRSLVLATRFVRPSCSFVAQNGSEPKIFKLLRFAQIG